MNTEQAVTPARLRELVSQAQALAAAVAAARDGLRTDPDEPTRRAGFRLDNAVGDVLDVADQMAATADDLARVRSRSICGADWGACPVHGDTLTFRAGTSWCKQLGCGRSWGYDRASTPCNEPTAFDVRDADGNGGPMCAGHTVGAREQLVGAVIRPLPSSSRGAAA